MVVIAPSGPHLRLARWTIGVVRTWGALPAVLEPTVHRVEAMWDSGLVDTAALLTAKRELWSHLDTKHGNSMTIADLEDRTVRAVLTLVEPSDEPQTLDDLEDWVLEMFPSAGPISP